MGSSPYTPQQPNSPFFEDTDNSAAFGTVCNLYPPCSMTHQKALQHVITLLEVALSVPMIDDVIKDLGLSKPFGQQGVEARFLEDLSDDVVAGHGRGNALQHSLNL